MERGGSLWLFVAGAIILVIAGVVLSIGSKVTQDVRDDELSTTAVSVTNESVSTLSETPQNFDVIGYHAFNAVASITEVLNDTTDTVVALASGNYTFNSTAIWLTAAGAADIYNGSATLNVSYVYNSEIYSISYNASDEATKAVGDLATWQGTIVTVIAAVIIIGLLLAGFGAFLYFRRSGGV